MRRREGRQDRRQPQRGGRLQRPERQQSPGFAVVADGAPRVFQEVSGPQRIRHQPVARRSQRYAPAMPVEQHRFQLRLEFSDAGGHVGLHGIQLGCGAIDRAEPRHRLEGPEIRDVHAGRVRYPKKRSSLA